MRYLTFTAPPSKEVRKAILRHRTDVLQIAAIYFATSRHRIWERGTFVLFYRANIYKIN